MQFIAELKKTTQRKAASMDQIYQLVLETNDPTILDLAKLPYETAFNVTIEVENG